MPELFSLSDPRTRFVQEFSTFYQLYTPDKYGKTVPASDPQRRRIIESLIQPIAFTKNDLIDDPVSDPVHDPVYEHDVWARYFLLHLYHQHPSFAAISKDHSDCTNFYDWIQYAIKLNSAYNESLNLLYQLLHSPQKIDSETNQVLFFQSPAQYSYELLQAYLQKPSWYAARSFFSRNIAEHAIAKDFPLEECFAITSQLALQVETVLATYKLQQSNQIRTYAERVLQGKLKDTIRQRDVAFRTQFMTQWGLLKQLARKTLRQAFSGYEAKTIQHYELVLKTFKELYQHKQQGGQKRLPDPSEQEIQLMCDRYNQRCNALDLPETNIQAFIDALATINNNVRHYYQEASHSTVPLNQLEAEGDSSADFEQPKAWIQKGHAASDYLVAYDPAELLEADEYQEQSAQLQTILSQVFIQLEQPCQAALHLSSGLGFTTTEIGQIMGVHQSSVSRKISSCRRNLVKQMLQTVQESYPNVNQQTLGENLKLLQDLIEEWLQDFSQQTFSRLLTSNSSFTADSSEDFQNVLPAFRQQVEARLSVDLSQCDRADQKLLDFIEKQVNTSA